MWKLAPVLSPKHPHSRTGGSNKKAGASIRDPGPEHTRRGCRPSPSVQK